MDPETEVVTPETPAEPQPFEARLEASINQKIEQHAAQESVAEEAVVAEKTPEADSTETVAETEAVTPAQPERLVVTPEQLADNAYWGALDKVGWERMTRDYPVETRLYKSAQAAATRLVNEARKAAATEPAKEEPNAAQQLDEAIKAASKKTLSIDEDEAAAAQIELTELVLRKKDLENGIDPSEVAAERDVREALKTAVREMPELATIAEAHSKDLDAVVDGDPEMQRDLELAGQLPRAQRVALMASVMRRAGKVVMANQAAAAKAATDAAATEAAKKAEQQKRARSNQTNPTAVLVDTPSGKAPGGKKPMEQFIHEQVAALTRQ